ncbi:hypothetical protein BB559_003319 [Furculomyces boomerangus]|uniref:YCII-related domain-containing protein n=2 Tax=Harpellales TaxID=61421 RepID=A0A2T9YLV9_9FUNG|nr:hypothetical protein BB559_003319 [Furculomyces boomerangus]PWA01555.1 hypothetical protein BB558_002336 [Smittium angustum]
MNTISLAFSSTRKLLQANNMNKYLIVVKDFADSECLSRRLSVRQRHMEGAKIIKQNQVLDIGGAILDESQDDKMSGSFLIVNADSVEDVRTLLKNDIYGQSRVWDVENAQITKIKVAPL